MKVKSESEVAQSSPTLSHPMDCSPPGSSVHGIFQARVLEWVAIAFSRCALMTLHSPVTVGRAWVSAGGVARSEQNKKLKEQNSHTQKKSNNFNSIKKKREWQKKTNKKLRKIHFTTIYMAAVSYFPSLTKPTYNRNSNYLAVQRKRNMNGQKTHKLLHFSLNSNNKIQITS